MIANDVGPIGGSILNLSDAALDDLERAGLLGSSTPTVEITEDASPWVRRFEMRQRAQRLARAGALDGDERRMREAVRLLLLSKLPVVGAHPDNIADELRLPRATARVIYDDFRDEGWIDPRTGSANTVDLLGEATLDALLS